MQVKDDGLYSFVETNTPGPCSIYYRGNPQQNEQALREALPELYLSFKPRPGS